MELLELTGSQWPKRRRLLAHPVISLLRSNRLRAKTVLAEQATPAEHIGLLRPIKIVFGPFESNVAGRSFKKASEVIPFGRRAFDILPTLLDWPGEIISKGDLIAKAWHAVTVDAISPLMTIRRPVVPFTPIKQ